MAWFSSRERLRTFGSGWRSDSTAVARPPEARHCRSAVFGPFVTRSGASGPTSERGEMALDKAAVAHIAALARIRLTAAELEPLAAELSHVLSWVEQLAEIDT